MGKHDQVAILVGSLQFKIKYFLVNLVRVMRYQRIGDSSVNVCVLQ